jgi:hypothetical protein
MWRILLIIKCGNTQVLWRAVVVGSASCAYEICFRVVSIFPLHMPSICPQANRLVYFILLTAMVLTGGIIKEGTTMVLS